MGPVTKEKIIWIAVPWAVGKPDTKARVSILVSPRLEGNAMEVAFLGPATAAGGPPHCNFIDWPAVLEKLSIVVKVGDPQNLASATPFEFSAPKTDRALWSLLFGNHTPVAPFGNGLTPTSSDAVILTYKAHEVHQLVKKSYVDAVVPPPSTNTASIQQFANPDGPLAAFFDFHQRPQSVTTTSASQEIVAAETIPSNCEVHRLSEGDRGRLIVIAPTSVSDVLRPQCYVLPALKTVEAYAITFRNQSDTEVIVRTADDTSIGSIASAVVVPPRVAADDDVVFRVAGGKWKIERERALDFHEAVSALTPYPELMRRLGLLFDVELPFSLSDDIAQSGFVMAAPVDPPKGCTIASESISPWTAFATTHIAAMSVFSARPAQIAIEGGLLLNDPSRHHILQMDVDGAAFKLLAHAGTTIVDAQTNDVARQIAPDAPTEAPALRHGGFTLVDEEMGAEVRRAIERRDKHEADFQNDKAPLLFADDLIQGYRIDVSRDGGAWRSLCQRHGEYRAGHDAVPIKGIPNDEGHVALVTDQKPGGQISISPAVFRWDGWSLSVPHPAKPITAGGHVADQQPRAPHATFPLQVEFSPVAGSLERLRYDSKYDFRARAVDVAGNALTVKEATAITDQMGNGFVFREDDGGAYDRFEPVDAPVVAPLQPPSRSETADVLVIRQTEDGGIEKKAWMVLPPKVSEALAEKHGVLDRLGDPRTAWKAIVARDGTVPGGAEGDYDPKWLDAHRDREVPYFGDPIARGAAFNGLPGASAAARVPFFATDPLKARPFRLVLSGGREGVSARGRELAVAIPQGRAFEVALSSYVDDRHAAMFAPWRWIAAENRTPADEAAKLASSGRLPGVTPPRKLRLVHAVQKPLVPSGGIRFLDFVMQPRNEGEVAAKFDGELAIDVLSTGRLDLQAAWSETVDNPALPSWSIEPHAVELFPRNVGPNGEAETVNCKPPAPAHDGFPICGTQVFSDTHHRKVRYRAQAVSRFLEFYPESLTSKRENVSRPSAEFEIHVPSSAYPTVPRIAYVVPAFAWTDETLDRHTLQTTRVSLFRVYLERGWFSSGDDEMAAVVLAPNNADMRVIGELVTEWGVDPIWNSETLTEPPRLADFDAVQVTAAPPVPCIPEVRRQNVVATLRREKKDDGTVEEVTAPVDIAAYPVALDAEKNLLYFDLAINTHHAYFPFVRLALARYQPCSIDRKHLSQVVRATFTQVTPNRTVTMHRCSTGEFEVTVAGPSYAPHDPKPNLSLGRRASVELTLERKESGFAKSRMDWFPITDPSSLAASGNAAETVWRGSIKTRWLQRDAYHRVVIKEFEHFYADPLDANTTDASEMKRLVFAHAVPLDEV